jgi:MutS domain V
MNKRYFFLRTLWIFTYVVVLMLPWRVLAHNLIVDDNLSALTAEERENIIKDLMQEHPHAMSSTKPIIDEKNRVWGDLGMESVIRELDRTKTVVGKQKFYELMKPLSDRNELEDRGVVIESLVSNVIKYEALEKLIADYREREELLVTFFSSRTEIKENLQNLSWVDNLASVSAEDKNGNIPMSTVWSPGAQVRSSQIVTPFNALILPFMGVYSSIISLPQILDGIMQNSRHNADRGTGYAVFQGAEAGGRIVFNGLISLAMLGTFPIMYGTLLRLNASIRTLHGLMISLSSIMQDFENLEDKLPKECKAFHDALATWQDYFDKDSPSYSADLCTFVDLMRSSNFSGTPSANIGTSVGELFRAYKHFFACKDKFVTLMHAYGTADAYLSVVTLYKEYAQSNLPWTKVAFTDTKKPYYSLKNAYNPLIPRDHAVVNSFVLGDNAHHMLLTGPHGCGKTTAMRTILLCIVLGQAILWTPASEATISLFTTIGTYMNITDDLEKGKSSFMAEKQRMKELYAMAKQCSADDVCLLVIDEPYAKTLQVVGEAFVYEFINDLRTIPQVMMIFATHFEKPASLEAETQGQVENYQPELREPKPGDFERTFRILKGPAKWWFEDPIRRRAFVNWLGEV